MELKQQCVNCIKWYIKGNKTFTDSAVCLNSVDSLKRNVVKQEWSAQEQRIRSGKLVPAGFE